MLETLDIVDRRLKDRSLVGPDVSYQLVVRLIVLRQQRAQLLDAIVDVEPSSSFN